jgi:TfoX/Sxy family transcriptional regulator of competence genes
MAGKTSVEKSFAAVSERLSQEPDVEQGSAFQSPGLKVHGKIFAMLVKGELVVKLPAERVNELVSAGAGRPFESGRRVMKEWVSLRPADEEAYAAYVVEAHNFVAAQTKH